MLLYPRATYRLVTNHSGAMTDHLGLILHVQAGDGSPFGWFSDPSSQASSTWWIGKDGTVEQYVDADLKAWAQMAGNATYNSVETEGQPSEPLTPAQVEQLAELYAWGVRHCRWPLVLAEQPGQRGFGWHGMGGAAWGGHIYCPGDLRKAQRVDVLARARQILTPAPSPTPEGDDMKYQLYRIAENPDPVYALRPGLVDHVSKDEINALVAAKQVDVDSNGAAVVQRISQLEFNLMKGLTLASGDRTQP